MNNRKLTNSEKKAGETADGEPVFQQIKSDRKRAEVPDIENSGLHVGEQI